MQPALTYVRARICRQKGWPALLLLLCVFLSANVCASAASAPLILTGERTSLNSNLQYVEDLHNDYTLTTIRGANVPWQQNGNETLNKGINISPWWLRLTITNSQPAATERLLELNYSILNNLDVYVLDGDVIVAEFNTGSHKPFHSRPLPTDNFVFPLHWQPQQTLKIYIRIQTFGALKAPLMLWQKDDFYFTAMTQNIFQGFYYGAILIIAIYNLLLYSVVKSRAYLYYVGNMACLALTILSITGQGYHYFWPNQVAWNDHSSVFFLNTLIIFGGLFLRNFLSLWEYSSSVNRAAQVYVATGMLLLIATFFVRRDIGLSITLSVSTVGVVLILVAGGIAVRRRKAEARFFLLAGASLLAGALIQTLSTRAILPSNLLTNHALELGSLIEAVLLSFALAHRINTERRLRLEAQAETLATARMLNEELEHQVAERTTQLSSANNKLVMLNSQLQSLSDTDQLTNLKNRRFLETRLQEIWSHCHRHGHSLSIVMIDVDHFKQVNDAYGHLGGDDCLRQVAMLIQNGIRWPMDLAARYGGEEFCLVLPETDCKGATAVIERILASVRTTTISTEGSCFQVTMSAGIYSGIPADEMSTDDFLQKADQALYQSKNTGRNRCTVAT